MHYMRASDQPLPRIVNLSDPDDHIYLDLLSDLLDLFRSTCILARGSFVVSAPFPCPFLRKVEKGSYADALATYRLHHGQLGNVRESRASEQKGSADRSFYGECRVCTAVQEQPS